MQFKNHELEEFARLYKEEFKEDLSLGEARIVALQLMMLYQRLAVKLPEERDSAADTGDRNHK